MLAYEEHGNGPPLLLLHGTPSSRQEWRAGFASLSSQRRVIAVDLPGFGESPAATGAVLPSHWVAPILKTLDALDVSTCAVVGSSMGGWTALELAKTDRVTAVLALSPAGLWANRSPLIVNAQLRVSRGVGRITPGWMTKRILARPRGRRLVLRSMTVDGGKVAAEHALAVVDGSLAASGWPAHYHAAKNTRFTGGRDIAVPVRVVWGDKDIIAPARTSRQTDQLPAHATVETWPDCAHSLLWDAPERTIEAALALPTQPPPR